MPPDGAKKTCKFEEDPRGDRIKNVLITGPTGMIGGMALEYALKRRDVGRVTIITRRKTGIKHKKLLEVIHEDFMDYSAISDHLRELDVVIYCIGVYTGGVPEKEHEHITVDFTKSFAKAVLNHSKALTFCFLSGAGADRKEKSRMIFARSKGKAENFLLKQKFKAVYFFRPGYIYPVKKRKEPNFGYKVYRFLWPVLGNIMPNMGINSDWLAHTMVDVGLKGNKKHTLENKDIRERYKKIKM